MFQLEKKLSANHSKKKTISNYQLILENIIMEKTLHQKEIHLKAEHRRITSKLKLKPSELTLQDLKSDLQYIKGTLDPDINLVNNIQNGNIPKSTTDILSDVFLDKN